jgi:VCBS repeat-containing protein
VLVVQAATGLLGSLLDGDGDLLHVELVEEEGPAHGTLILHPDGSFVYTPYENYSTPEEEPDTFQYVISDGALESDPITVEITARDSGYLIARTDEGELAIRTWNSICWSKDWPMGQATWSLLFSRCRPFPTMKRVPGLQIKSRLP